MRPNMPVNKTIKLFSCILILSSVNSFAQSIPRPEYPRPQFERTEWINLNGEWTYTFDFSKSGLDQGFQNSQGFKDNIIVPFCPESELSGVGFRDFIPVMWYHSKIEIPKSWRGKLHLL